MSELSESLSSVLNKANVLEVEIAEESTKSREICESLEMLQKEEQALRDLVEKERMEVIEAELDCEDLDAVMRIPERTQPARKPMEEDVLSCVGNEYQESKIKEFFASCSSFRDKFSAAKIKHRDECLDLDEATLSKEMANLRKRKREFVESLQRCEGQLCLEHQERNKLQSVNRNLHERLERVRKESEDQAGRIAHEQQMHRNAAAQLTAKILAAEQEIEQLKVSLSLQNVELMELVERKRQRSPPPENLAYTAGTSFRTPRITQPVTRASSNQPRRNQIQPSNQQGHKQNQPRSPTIQPSVSHSTPKRQAQMQKRPNKKQRNQSERNTLSSSDTTSTIETDMFGGIRH